MMSTVGPGCEDLSNQVPSAEDTLALGASLLATICLPVHRCTCLLHHLDETNI